jgi:hypothetical protein
MTAYIQFRASMSNEKFRKAATACVLKTKAAGGSLIIGRPPRFN